MYLRDMDGLFGVDSDGHILAQPAAKLQDFMSGHHGFGADPTIMDGPSDFQIPGNLDGAEDVGDVYSVHLTAGVTYSFAERPTATGGIVDPFMALFNPDGTVVLAQDDDGGAGRSSMITYTPTADGDYLLLTGSWVNIFSTGGDTGNYTIDIWSPDADAPATTAGAFAIEEGVTTFGHIASTSDIDTYKIDLTAGMFYTFSFSGGVATAAELGEAGSVEAKLELLDANGQVISTNTSLESGLGFLAPSDGTYYVRLSSAASTSGGYTLDVSAVDPATKSPLDAIIWDSASNVHFVDVNGVPTAYVYFAVAGENFGEKQGDNGADGIPNSGDEALISLGWNDYEKGQVMDALNYYEHILGINFEITTDSSLATFRLITTKQEPYGARFYPQDPAYGTQQGIGTFNVDSGGWGAFPQSLQEGGFSYSVILHEFGHAFGLSHPHDNGGGSDIMLGVTASQGSYGIYNLNQGVYTVMSYNEAWDFNPDGPSSFTVAGIDNGWSTLGAFDIAALQERYGVTPYHTGNDTYTLTDVVDDAFYQCIWDSGGNDTIAYNGNLNAQIDLLAATLDYSPTGGGAISFLHNATPLPVNSARVKGGFTIANGVVIENATGGGGNDVLLGNAANNVLTGNGGNDTLMGREGNDQILGGAGVDTVFGGDGIDVINLGAGDDIFVAENGAKSSTKAGSWSWDVITDFDANGDDKIDLSGFDETFHFRGTNANKAAGDVSFKVYDSINGAEKALGIDIDGQPGASGVSGPVTIVYVNHDGGSPDVGIVLLHTSSVDASDFIFS
jgi:serralysin